MTSSSIFYSSSIIETYFWCSFKLSLWISSSSSFIISSSSLISFLVIFFDINFSSSSFFLFSHLYSLVRFYSAVLLSISAFSSFIFYSCFYMTSRASLFSIWFLYTIICLNFVKSSTASSTYSIHLIPSVWGASENALAKSSLLALSSASIASINFSDFVLNSLWI